MKETLPARTLPALVEAAADRFGEAPAIQQDGQTISYRRLNQGRVEAARAFLAAGIRKGDRVAICAANCPEWIIAATGLQTLGAILVPLNPRLQPAESADILERSGAGLFLCGPDLPHGIPSIPTVQLSATAADGRLSWPGFLSTGAGIPDAAVAKAAAEVRPEDTMDMLFTSGTTGRPKGVLCSHEQNIRVFTTWADTVGLGSEDRYLIINPFFHSFGYKAGWLAALIKGCLILPVATFGIEEVLQQIERDKVTMLPGAPSLYEMLLNAPDRSRYDLSSLRLGVTGAASVPVQLVRDMQSELGFATVVTAYGLTESTGVVSICRPDDAPETIAGTSGRAIDGVDVRIIDPGSGAVQPAGREGEIQVRGYNVMQGYFDMPEATRETIIDGGWLRTGDIGVMDERGYLRITDRLKDMYIMNGQNVYPAEVEKALYALPGIRQVAVIGIPQKPQGEVGMAWVVGDTGLTAEAVTAFCREHLAPYKIPARIRFVDDLPLNATGKVLKTVLKQRAAEGDHD